MVLPNASHSEKVVAEHVEVLPPPAGAKRIVAIGIVAVELPIAFPAYIVMVPPVIGAPESKVVRKDAKIAMWRISRIGLRVALMPEAEIFGGIIDKICHRIPRRLLGFLAGFPEGSQKSVEFARKIRSVRHVVAYFAKFGDLSGQEIAKRQAKYLLIFPVVEARLEMTEASQRPCQCRAQHITGLLPPCGHDETTDAEYMTTLWDEAGKAVVGQQNDAREVPGLQRRNITE